MDKEELNWKLLGIPRTDKKDVNYDEYYAGEVWKDYKEKHPGEGDAKTLLRDIADNIKDALLR